MASSCISGWKIVGHLIGIMGIVSSVFSIGISIFFPFSTDLGEWHYKLVISILLCKLNTLPFRMAHQIGNIFSRRTILLNPATTSFSNNYTFDNFYKFNDLFRFFNKFGFNLFPSSSKF